jgi:hypothetical protein
MLKLVTAALTLFAVGCNHATFDQDIIGEWENAGAPSSTGLPETVRMSPDWSATIDFKDDGTFAWRLDSAEGGQDVYGGVYKVVGYSLEITVTSMDGTPLPSDRWLEYTVRQQSTGAIQFPLPQDWTGPTVDYFRKN